MRTLRYAINVTLDGCCDHTAITPDEEMHNHAARGIEEADVLLFGRVTYEMMVEGWREVAQTGVMADWMTDWMVPFAKTIDAAKKYVVSRTLSQVDWNAELVTGDLEAAIRELKSRPGGDILTGGVTLPLALGQLGLIDEYDLLIHPVIAGHGPYLQAGLPKGVVLKALSRRELASGAVAMRYAVAG